MDERQAHAYHVDEDNIYSLDTLSQCIGSVVKEEDIYLIKDLQGNILYELRD